MARLRPLVDYRAALTSGQGVGRYSRELARALAARDDVDLRLFGPTWQRADVDRSALGVERVRLFRRRIPSKALERALVLARVGVERLVGGADVVLHTQYRRLPTRRPEVATIHDLVFLDSDRFVGAATAARMSAFVRAAARDCRAIVTPSEAVADEVAERLDVARERVFATPLGVDHVHRIRVDPEDAEALAAAMRVRGPFFFTAARLETRKNLVTVLRAFEGLVDTPARWLVAGTPGDGGDAFLEAVRRSPAAPRIELLGHITESNLRAHIEACIGFVLVPHDEGFGLAPLEAMALGSAAVTSDVPVVREVCGGGAELVSPLDVVGLRRVLQDWASFPGAQSRRRDAGLRHAERFPWARTAEATMGALVAAVAAG